MGDGQGGGEVKLRGRRKRRITVGFDELTGRETAALSVSAEPDPELSSWELEQATVTIIVAGAVIGGGFIILVSAFFGLVMPTRVHETGEWHKHSGTPEE